MSLIDKSSDKKPSPTQLLAELNEYVVTASAPKRIEQCRTYFEHLVNAFPLSGRFWKLYIEAEMKQREYERVEKLFQRCLIRVRHIELWRCYLHYVRETKSGHAAFREKMGQAYEFALDKVGIDFLAYPIWSEYVAFLKGVEAVGSYAENQKITAVRRVYQRGVVTPMLNIEAFWKEYVAYEQGINPMIAEKMIADRSRDYMSARRVAKEYEAFTKGLNRNAPALAPSGRAEERRQVDLWERYIAWEQANPLRLEEPGALIKRVVFAFEQCLLCLSQHAHVWLQYAVFLESRARAAAERGDVQSAKQLQDDAAAVYERSVTGSMAGSTLVHFGYADFEEARNRKEKAGEIYQRLLASEALTDPTLAYIQYIRFARRSEGIKSARFVFKKAREDSRSTHHVYTFAALMEFHCSKDKNVACKIFELGLKKYADNAEYVLSYIDFFAQLNEENNTRVLFERVLSADKLADECALRVWDRFLAFESDVGDLQSIAKVERRRGELLERLHVSGRLKSALQWTQRYRFSDLLPIQTHELRALRSQSGASKYATWLSGPAAPNSPVETEVTDVSETRSFTPDVSQMIPYKPARLTVPNAHTLPGGIFPPPAAVGQLLAILPHPSCFHGPFVQIDELMTLLREMQLPEQFRSSSANGSVNLRQFDVSVKASLSLFGELENTNSPMSADCENSNGRRINKRSLLADEDEEEPDDDNSNSNPAYFDIYRKRQLLKKVK